MANIPPYLVGDNSINYNVDLAQTLYDNIGPNGYVIPQVTSAQMTLIGTTALDGTLVYCTDTTPPGPYMLVQGVFHRVAIWVGP